MRKVSLFLEGKNFTKHILYIFFTNAQSTYFMKNMNQPDGTVQIFHYLTPNKQINRFSGKRNFSHFFEYTSNDNFDLRSEEPQQRKRQKVSFRKMKVKVENIILRIFHKNLFINRIF